MKILNMNVELAYDESNIYEDDIEAFQWFIEDVLRNEDGLVVYSNDLKDEVGKIKIISIEGIDKNYGKPCLHSDQTSNKNQHILNTIYRNCVEQVSTGKGEERHGKGCGFLDQKWIRITDAVGLGFLTGQAMKKTEEAQIMEDVVQWEKEMLGAINYLAMAVLYRRIKENRMG